MVRDHVDECDIISVVNLCPKSSRLYPSSRHAIFFFFLSQPHEHEADTCTMTVMLEDAEYSEEKIDPKKIGSQRDSGVTPPSP